MKTILLIGGGIETVVGVDQLHEMGLRVVVVDRDACCPCADVADDVIVASTYDVQEVVEQVWWYDQVWHHINAVMCLATDVPITAYAVAQVLGLPNIGWYAAACGANKLLQRMVLQQNGVLVPWYQPVYDYICLDRMRQQHDNLVVKPVDSRGARGVIRLLHDVGTKWAYDTALEQSPSKHVLAEHWVDGIQISTEGVVLDGIYHHVAMVDRNYDMLNKFAPYVIENGGQQPTVLRDDEQASVVKTMQAAAVAIGLTNGTLKGDLVVRLGDTRPHVYVIEVAPRLSGGYMSTVQIPLATGVPLVQIAARIALGQDVDVDELEPRARQAVAIRYAFPTTPTSHPERGAHMIGTGATVAEAVANACNVYGPYTERLRI
jgi:biotin carboxylase